MSETQFKPRLVFFQYKYESLAPFLLIHQREHVDCLSQFFDVTVIQEDCDYQQICDTYEPDLVMFESGVPFPTCRRPTVTNVRAYPGVPKIGFLHADAFGEGRAGFLSDMDHWGIETFFSIATTVAEHTPAIANNVFVWPNFVNPSIYHDYGEKKNIPVLFTGNNNTLYPWRQSMVHIVPQHYASLTCPHPGYIPPARSSITVVVGEAYARLLNASWFVPACGTVAKEVVRKHFEIPACRACLVSEKSPALEAAGFIDMQNCVLADEHDIVDKLHSLFEHQEQLEAIIDSSHKLVHERHTMAQRDQVLQWFTLQKTLKVNQKIVQVNPFEPLQVVDKKSGLGSSHIRSNGGFVTLLRTAHEHLWKGDYVEAESLYLRCVSYYRYMPEPLLGLTQCKLFQGKPEEAMTYIVRPHEATLADYKAIDPDPVEWAYFLITLLCLGKVREAIKRSQEFEWLHHPELERVRRVIDALTRRTPTRLNFTRGQQLRLTVHQLPDCTVERWISHLVSMLRACGQEMLARKVASLATTELGIDEVERFNNSSSLAVRVDEAELRRAGSRKAPFVYFRTDAFGLFNRRRLYLRIILKAKGAVKLQLRVARGLLTTFMPKPKNRLASQS